MSKLLVENYCLYIIIYFPLYHLFEAVKEKDVNIKFIN